MGSTVARLAVLLLLFLVVGEAVRHASTHEGDVVSARKAYEKREQERVEPEHVQEGQVLFLILLRVPSTSLVVSQRGHG